MGKLGEILQLAQQRARAMNLAYAGALTPQEAWRVLCEAPGACLIDVRTHAELEWVGRIPGAVEIEWIDYPARQRNPNFLLELKKALPQGVLLLFICRSGVRSDQAAQLATEAGFVDCYNVLEGFEGNKDADGHRNSVGGWRVAGLPWTQG